MERAGESEEGAGGGGRRKPGQTFGPKGPKRGPAHGCICKYTNRYNKDACCVELRCK